MGFLFKTCVSANRILVQADIMDKFVKALREKMLETLVVGDGFDVKSTQGPLANKQQCEKVEHLVQDAVSKGGLVLTGGKRKTPGSLFYEPTLLTEVNNTMEIFHEEIFGPVASIIK